MRLNHEALWRGRTAPKPPGSPGLFSATNPSLLPPEGTHFLFPSFFIRLKAFLSLFLRRKSTALAVALHHTWHLSREKVGGCQPGCEEPVWVLRVMEIYVRSVFPREFWAARG